MKKLLMAAAIAGVAAFVIKTKARQEGDWHGLTESEARERLDAKLPSRIPDDKRELITDRVVSKMRDRGVLSDDGESLDLTDSGGLDQPADSTGEVDLSVDESVASPN